MVALIATISRGRCKSHPYARNVVLLRTTYIGQINWIFTTFSNILRWLFSYDLHFETAPFSSVGYEIVVGVIRPSSRKALQGKGLVGVAQISTILKKNLGSLTGQDFRGFLR